MPSPAAFATATGSIRSASASMEARFFDIGGRLGTAVDTIGALTRTFDRLANELKSENLRNATQALSQIMSRVVALADLQNDGQVAFGQLADLTSRIQHRILLMGKAVNGIGVLAMNARIEAANIGDAGLDFIGFTKDIGRTLHLATTSLDQFAAELGAVGTHLGQATTSQRALAQHQAAAIQSVPVRLAANIHEITDRGTRAVAAASAVSQKSRQVGQSISDAVMALQIGDITRQRLEHVEYALAIVAEILEPPDGPTHADWSALAMSQRHALASLCTRLVSAQLLDAADEFDRKVRQILSAVQDLAADADDILRLGNTAVGASADRRGTFLGKVEGEVAEVEALLKDLAKARQEADTVAASVSEATGRLVSHTSTLRSLEEDIRIMGLNMTLKCGRLDGAGRPLMVIAQELRVYSNQIAAEAGGVAVHLEAIMAIAGSLSGREQERRAADIAAVAAIMADSVAHLATAGESLAAALATLAHHTEDVAVSLRETVSRTTVHEELASALRQAAAELTRATADGAAEDVIATPQRDRMLDLIVRSYTMERERVVHEQELPGEIRPEASTVTPDPALKAAPAELEDFFF